MRWPWSRLLEQRAAATAEAEAQTRAQEAQSAEAVQRAQRRLDDARRLEPRVNWLVAQLRELRNPDEFAARLATTFRERR